MKAIVVTDQAGRRHGERGSGWLGGRRLSRMRERRRCFAADNRRRLVDKRVVFESCHNEKSEVHAAGNVLARMGSPTCRLQTGRPSTLPLFEVAPSHNSPPRVACKHAPTRLHLVIEVHDAGDASKPTDDMHEQFDLPRLHVLAIACDVPPAREHEARPRTHVVKNGLRCP